MATDSSGSSRQQSAEEDRPTAKLVTGTQFAASSNVQLQHQDRVDASHRDESPHISVPVATDNSSLAKSKRQPARPDWEWTLLLFAQKLDWREIMAIRQMDDEELSSSLCSALRAGGKVERSWINTSGASTLSVGQQRVVREIQRRAAAGLK